MTLSSLRSAIFIAKKEKDLNKASTLTMVLTEALNIAKNDGNREATDDDVSNALKRTLKRSEQSLEFNVPGSKEEVYFLKSLLPSELSEPEIKSLVDKLKETHGNNKGIIMKALKDVPGMNMAVASKMI